MAGEKARQFSGNMVHYHMAKFDYTNIGAGPLAFGDIPACQIVDIYVAKTADFNAGSTSTLDIGIDYSDTTTDDPDALVDGIDLSSSTALGPLEVTQVDSAAWTVTVPATLTLSPAATGTAASAGAGYVVVAYVPLSEAKDLT